MARGLFITVEGIEGTGKSTNIDYLTDLIRAKGFDVETTREPGGTPMAENIRALLLDHGQEPVSEDAELLLFFAARSLHLQNRILPALEDGRWVVLRPLHRCHARLPGQRPRAGRGQDRAAR